MYFLTFIDRFTRWTEALPMRDIPADTVALAFDDGLVSRYGVRDNWSGPPVQEKSFPRSDGPAGSVENTHDCVQHFFERNCREFPLFTENFPAC